jgi:hypothetical protein
MKGLWIFLACATFLAVAFIIACGGGSSSSLPPQTITTTGPNVTAIAVNGGPVTGQNYVDAAFTNVTVCVPGTTTCQTIGGILVDTGSSGLRILSTALTGLALPQQTSSSGSPIVECFPFVSGYTWGPVQTADVEMASEKASSVPIQVLSDSDFTAPSSCTANGASSDTQQSLGANGILGVGLFTQDCGPACALPLGSNSQNPGIYYACPSSGCVQVAEATAQQVPNPVSLFTSDNNGVIIELPSVPGGEAPSLSGSLIFGIGTQSNNALGGATVYTANSSGDFTTNFQNTVNPSSFIDSGSNGYFFTSSITTCPTNSNAPGFYCPSSVQNLSATNQGANSASGTISFSIANAETLFNVPDSAYGDLGGTFSSGAFDWGLPFFFGRNVYTGLQSTTNPNGYWAY